MWYNMYPLTNTLNFKAMSTISLFLALVTLAIYVLYEAVSVGTTHPKNLKSGPMVLSKKLQ